MRITPAIKTAAIVCLAQFAVACGYVNLSKDKLGIIPREPSSIPSGLPGAQFVSSSSINSVTSPGNYKVSNELGISTGSVMLTTTGGYTIYQSVQSASYSP